jgi:3-oxoacyl-[acyl-carrier-protein] synthase II
LRRETIPRREPIAVTGYGLTTCLGRGAEANWQALAAGKSGLRPITRFPVEGYPVRDGGEAPAPGEEASRAFPPELRPLSHLIEACEEALAAAGVERGRTGPRTALVVGSSLAASDSSERFFRSYLERGPGGADYSALRSYYAEEQLWRLLERLELSGPALLVANACAAGASSIARAAELIRAGRCDRALASGYDALSPFTHAGFGSLLALARGRPRPFGAGRDGMKLGDGFAALLLEPLETARRAGRRVRAVLAGYGESADAHHLTHPHPEGLGAALAMRRALAMAGLDPSDIDYINCHGTATPSNDSAEALAMASVFGEALPRIPLNASKPNFGHTLGGAGTVEAVVTLLVLERQYLPPTLNVEDTEAALPVLDLVRDGRPARVTAAMSNSFGFGGCNASLVFTEPGGGA